MSMLPVRTRMGCGAMQLAGPHVFGPPKDRDEALRVLRRAAELGVDHVDTAQFTDPMSSTSCSARLSTPTTA